MIGFDHQRRQAGGQAIGFVLKRGKVAQAALWQR
jgi:hypothetical protein